MGKFSTITVSNKKIHQDKLRINLNAGKVKLSSRLIKYRDKDTRQIIYYIPALEVTGYGSTEEKAQEMLDFSVKEYFDFLFSLSQKQVEAELIKLGWKQEKFKNKEYSKSFVDGNGELKNFNAVANEIEELTIEA